MHTLKSKFMGRNTMITKFIVLNKAFWNCTRVGVDYKPYNLYFTVSMQHILFDKSFFISVMLFRLLTKE